MKSTPVTITRLVTCYRQWHLLARWLDHDALHQDGVDWMIVNDSPETPIPAEIQAIADRRGITMLTPRVNLGRCNARNWGVRQARSEWIDLVDGDDIPLRLDPAMLSGVDTDLVNCPIVTYELGAESETPIANPPEKGVTDRHPFGPTHINAMMYPSYMPADPRPVAMIYRRQPYLEIGGYDARYDDGWNDTEFLARAYLHGLTMHHAPTCKQAYLYQAPDAPRRIYSLSIYKLFAMLETYGDPQYREEFRKLRKKHYRSIFWQTIALGYREGFLTRKMRFSLALQLLGLRPLDCS